ncbi:MAG: prepilin-type N-terminal cleavage/methylation domain-containing protein [Planctomycetota bacterium]
MNRTGQERQGFTLVEVLAAIVVISIIGSIVVPVLTTLSRRHVDAVRERASVQAMSHAADQIVRLLRESPTRSDGSLAISVSAPDQIRFSDGRGLEFAAGDLVLHLDDGRSGTLLEAVDVFEIELLDAAGAAAPAEPGEAWRIRYRVETGEQVVAGVVFPRARLGGGAG